MDHQPGQEQLAQNILRTKLFIPHTHPRIIDRPRLANRLDNILQAKLAVISAPAGSGKTTILSTWISQRKLNAAWVSLDERDNDPVRFWSYFLAALQTKNAHWGQSARTMLQSPQAPPIEQLLTSVLNDLAQTQTSLYLVLDDYHTINNRSVHQGIEFFLANVSPQCHLLIASRSEVPLPLPQYRARRELIEFNPSDLRFTHAEAAAFLNQVMQLALSNEDIAKLEKKTEGWVAGLQLAALSLQGQEDVSDFIQSFSGTHRYIFDYLAQEVLDHQPADIQNFLLETSLLERLNAALCNEMLEREGCQEILEYLEHACLFLVPLDQNRGWYRYHHLFSEFLRTRLEQTASPDRILLLHQRACAWLDRNGLYGEAIDHAFQAGDFTSVSNLVETNSGTIFERSELITLLNWVGRLPQDQYLNRPLLSVICAWANLATNRGESAEQYLQKAENSLGVVADGKPVNQPKNALPLAEIACIRANLAFHNQDYAQVLLLSDYAEEYLTQTHDVRYFQYIDALRGVISFNRALVYEYTGNLLKAITAFEETIHRSQEPHNPHLLALSSSHLGQLLILQGKLSEAEQLFTSLLREQIHPVAQTSPMLGLVQVCLGNLLYERNELNEARRLLEIGVEQGRLWANWETLLPGFTGLAKVWNAVGDIDRALAVHEELEVEAHKMSVAGRLTFASAERAWLMLLNGEPNPVQQWLDTCQVQIGAEITSENEKEALYLARFLAALGHHVDAVRLSTDISASAEAGDRKGHLLEAWIIRALALEGSGETEQAEKAMHRALSIAAPQGYVRMFFDSGARVIQLLSRITGDQQTYASQLLRSVDDPRSNQGDKKPPRNQNTQYTGADMVEQLSEREIEVLRLIAQGLTNQEIADQLVISLNTVKTHVKNILGRLQVSNRTQAAARAREQGLI